MVSIQMNDTGSKVLRDMRLYKGMGKSQLQNLSKAQLIDWEGHVGEVRPVRERYAYRTQRARHLQVYLFHVVLERGVNQQSGEVMSGISGSVTRLLEQEWCQQ